ncbi:MAG: RloB domain-containing protein [Bacteroidetes bacterium]|nr:MAG: RloB domain-containing protein [Bacteroidota bacterium]
MRKSKNIRHQTHPVFAVVVDGETEVWYLQMLKRNERNLRISIKPEIPTKKSVEEQYNLVCELSRKEFSSVYWIVDLDSILKEANEAPKGKKSAIRRFEECRANLKAQFKNVVVIVNNPCLEFWFLLHFEKTSKYFATCSGAETQLKKYLGSYEKTRNYFTKQNDDIYLKLKAKLNSAIRNAAALGNFDHKNPTKAMCEMELLFHVEALKIALNESGEG